MSPWADRFFELLHRIDKRVEHIREMRMHQVELDDFHSTDRCRVVELRQKLALRIRREDVPLIFSLVHKSNEGSITVWPNICLCSSGIATARPGLIPSSPFQAMFRLSDHLTIMRWVIFLLP